MEIKATIMIDDDRWAKHPYGVKFDDEECNREFYTNGVDDQCYRVIKRARVNSIFIFNVCFGKPRYRMFFGS